MPNSGAFILAGLQGGAKPRWCVAASFADLSMRHDASARQETAGMPLRLAPQLWLVAGPALGDAGANCVLLGGDGPVLIDCGPPDGVARLVERIGALPDESRRGLRLVLTHCHWDHAAGANEVGARLPLAGTYIHEADHAALATADRGQTAAVLYGVNPVAVAGTRVVTDGDAFDTGAWQLKVLHTPGHTPGSISLLARSHTQSVLITGDAVWGHIHPAIGGDTGSLAASLERLSQLEADLLVLGHSNPPALPDAASHLRRAKRELDEQQRRRNARGALTR